MSNELEDATTVIYSTGAMYRITAPRKLNLGGAILLAAIHDYRGVDEGVHKDAELFLYPQTEDWLEQYEWAVAMADGVNPEWLRESLDRCKSKWDLQRLLRKQKKHRKVS